MQVLVPAKKELHKRFSSKLWKTVRSCLSDKDMQIPVARMLLRHVAQDDFEIPNVHKDFLKNFTASSMGKSREMRAICDKIASYLSDEVSPKEPVEPKERNRIRISGLFRRACKFGKKNASPQKPSSAGYAATPNYTQRAHL